jgi:Leucine-rich repeat (LRR) protein
MGKSSVVELILSNNSITRISNWSLISLPPTLRLLALDGNHIRELGIGALNSIDSRVDANLRKALHILPFSRANM